MMRLNESSSSVFYHSQEEESEKTGTESRTLLREEVARSPSDSYQEIVSEGSPVPKEQDLIGMPHTFWEIAWTMLRLGINVPGEVTSL